MINGNVGGRRKKLKTRSITRPDLNSRFDRFKFTMRRYPARPAVRGTKTPRHVASRRRAPPTWRGKLLRINIVWICARSNEFLGNCMPGFTAGVSRDRDRGGRSRGRIVFISPIVVRADLRVECIASRYYHRDTRIASHRPHLHENVYCPPKH